MPPRFDYGAHGPAVAGPAGSRGRRRHYPRRDDCAGLGIFHHLSETRRGEAFVYRDEAPPGEDNAEDRADFGRLRLAAEDGNNTRIQTGFNAGIFQTRFTIVSVFWVLVGSLLGQRVLDGHGAGVQLREGYFLLRRKKGSEIRDMPWEGTGKYTVSVMADYDRSYVCLWQMMLPFSFRATTATVKYYRTLLVGAVAIRCRVRAVKTYRSYTRQ